MSRPTLLFVACLILATSDSPTVSQPIPPPRPKLTPEQQEKLKERDRLVKKANKLQSDGKLTDARTAVEKMLAIEREVLGDTHIDVAGSLAWLTDLGVRLEDFSAAREHGRKALDVRNNIHGEAHWRTTDARLDLADVELREKLSKEQRADLDEATKLIREVRQLYERREYPKARLAATEKALFLREKILGEKHRLVADVLHWQGTLYDLEKDYAKAEKVYRRALELFKGVLGEKHPDYAACLNNFGFSYDSQGAYTKAEPLYKEAIVVRREVLGEKHPNYINSVVNLALMYESQRAYTKAEPLLREVITVRKEVLGQKHPQYASSVNMLARVFNAQGSYTKAEPLYREAVAIQKEILGGKHPDYAGSLNNLAALYREQDLFAKSEPLYKEALAIYKEVRGEKHPDYAACLNNLAALYSKQDCFVKAEQLYNEALAIKKEVVGVKHADYALSLNNLAVLYEKQGLYAKAEILYLEVLGINKEVLGEKHPNYAATLYNLALLYSAQGLFTKAETLYKETLAIQRDVLGKKHPDYAASLNGLAMLYESQWLWAKAEPLYLEALAVHKHVYGEQHSDFATSLNNLGFLYFKRGLFNKTEPLLTKAMTIRRKVFGEKHQAYAISLNNLALFYRHQGLYAKAEPLYKEALAIFKEALGEKHPHYATNLNNLALLYDLQGSFTKAESMYRESLAIRKEVFGEKHPHYASSLNNLGALYESRSLFTKAEPLYKEALAIYKDVLGNKHPSYAETLNNLGSLYSSQRLHAKAEPLYQEALATRQAALGEKHPDYAASLNNLAVLYQAQGLFTKAEPLYQGSIRIINNHLDETATSQAESGQFTYTAASRFYLDNLLRLPRTDAADMYAAIFEWRGAVTARQTFARATRNTDPVAHQTLNKLSEISRRLSNLVSNPPKPSPGVDLPRMMRDLDEQRETLEKKLAAQSKDFAKYRGNRDLKPAGIQKLLPADAVLIDFLVYANNVAAFIITPKSVTRVDLKASTSEIAEMVNDFRSGSSLKRTRPVQGDGDQSVLREAVWEPLVPHLQGVNTVLICPDGPLCRLPFAALRGNDPKKYLIEELAIAVIPVPKLLPELLAERPAGSPSLLVVGDVDFSGDPSAGRLPSDLALSPTRAGGLLAWKQLAATADEIEKIDDLFRKNVPGAVVKSLTKGDATEAAIRRVAGKQRYLHFATHGFFADPKPAVKTDPNTDGLIGERPRVPIQNPGLLCGLVCAGANKPTADDDGVLTALEIADLDLSGVELAVLSACETGLGEVAGGDGVLGLQRAFQLAGAKTTVTSLWQVPDEATGSLMVRFYENRLKRGMPVLKALREAQLWVLNEGVQAGVLKEEPKNGRRTPPLYWAAFVLAGDWR